MQTPFSIKIKWWKLNNREDFEQDIPESNHNKFI